MPFLQDKMINKKTFKFEDHYIENGLITQKELFKSWYWREETMCPPFYNQNWRVWGGVEPVGMQILPKCSKNLNDLSPQQPQNRAGPRSWAALWENQYLQTVKISEWIDRTYQKYLFLFIYLFSFFGFPHLLFLIYKSNQVKIVLSCVSSWWT